MRARKRSDSFVTWLLPWKKGYTKGFRAREEERIAERQRRERERERRAYKKERQTSRSGLSILRGDDLRPFTTPRLVRFDLRRIPARGMWYRACDTWTLESSRLCNNNAKLRHLFLRDFFRRVREKEMRIQASVRFWSVNCPLQDRQMYKGLRYSFSRFLRRSPNAHKRYIH